MRAIGRWRATLSRSAAFGRCEWRCIEHQGRVRHIIIGAKSVNGVNAIISRTKVESDPHTKNIFKSRVPVVRVLNSLSVLIFSEDFESL